MNVLPLIFLLSGVAFAQDTSSAPALGDVSIPTSDWVLISTLIGLVVKEVASPLTALLKKRFSFEGNVTQLVYAALSLVFTLLYGFANNGFGHGANGLVNGFTLFIVALVKGYGDYAKQIQASAAGVAVATQTQPTPGA